MSELNLQTELNQAAVSAVVGAQDLAEAAGGPTVLLGARSVSLCD